MTASDTEPTTPASTDTTVEETALPLNVHNIDPDGDLLLDVQPDDEGRWRYRVCSATLRRHSPVWKTMLFGPWKESKPATEGEWVVELPEDPPYEMQTILYIIHGLVDKVPEALSGDSVFRLLILLNKYDMTRIVKPWCAKWMVPAEQSIWCPVTKSLYIAWELGNESLFTLRLTDIALNTQMVGNVLVFKRWTLSSLPFATEGFKLEDEEYLGPSDILGM